MDHTAQKVSVFGVILVRIFPAFSRTRTEYGVFSPNAGKCLKNTDQNNSEYGLFLRSIKQLKMNDLLLINGVSLRYNYSCKHLYL